MLVVPLIRAELDRIGSRGGLSVLPDVAMLGANPLTAGEYAKTVREHAARRHAVRAATDVIALANT